MLSSKNKKALRKGWIVLSYYALSILLASGIAYLAELQLNGGLRGYGAEFVVALTPVMNILLAFVNEQKKSAAKELVVTEVTAPVEVAPAQPPVN